MDKLENRAVFKFFVLDGLTDKEIHPRLTKNYENSAPISTVKKRAAEFERGCTSLEDDPREGRSKITTKPCRGRRLDSSSAMRFGQDPRSPLMILAALAWILSILDKLVLLELIQAGVAYSKIGLTSARYVLDVNIREKRPGLGKKKIIFNHDNAPAHKSVLTIGNFGILGTIYSTISPYSPDLALSYFYLFPHLINFFSGERFVFNEEGERAVNQYFNSLPDYHFPEGILILEKCWTKYAEVNRSILHNYRYCRSLAVQFSTAIEPEPRRLVLHSYRYCRSLAVQFSTAVDIAGA
ncbi:hypothetical protein LAZ67_2002931 [Cordylochernes scorpioides]|uniref:Transposase n=1 Tax=Cordylochernes scorpioides TaxID=51811 RepID=A0ABY6K2D5_9ARAC|nr:hypothetical protein LAZ67_2002931 [Cordylochernes scorpioides]